VGGERQSLIDLELARTEFRLDVIKLRKQLSEIGVGKSMEKPPEVAVVTTRHGTVAEPASDTASSAPVVPTKVAEPKPSADGAG
jgi:hypothetical protein